MIKLLNLRRNPGIWIAVSSAMALIAAVAVLGLTHGTARTRSRAAYDRATLDVGDHISVPGLDFSRSDLNLIVATSPTCAACRASGTFYRALRAFAQTARVPLYFFQAEQDDEDPTGAPAATNIRVIHTRLASIGIFVVPTIAVIDRHGRVKSAHFGAVEIGGEESMIADLINGAPRVALPVGSATETEVNFWRRTGEAVQILDVRSPGQSPEIRPFSGSLDIPLSDLDIRARYELDRKQTVVVDCRPVGRYYCQDALLTLRQRHFQRIVGIDYALGDSHSWYPTKLISLFTQHK
jgi:rhodanese-related sulfurtransferase